MDHRLLLAIIAVGAAAVLAAVQKQYALALLCAGVALALYAIGGHYL